MTPDLAMINMKPFQCMHYMTAGFLWYRSLRELLLYTYFVNIIQSGVLIGDWLYRSSSVKDIICQKLMHLSWLQRTPTIN